MYQQKVIYIGLSLIVTHVAVLLTEKLLITGSAAVAYGTHTMMLHSVIVNFPKFPMQ